MKEKEQYVRYTAKLIELEEKKIANTKVMRERLWEEAILGGKQGAPSGKRGRK